MTVYGLDELDLVDTVTVGATDGLWVVTTTEGMAVADASVYPAA
jgi:hypothetical protein